MTFTIRKLNPKTGEFELVEVLSDSLGLFGRPTINITGKPLYDKRQLEDMGYKSHDDKKGKDYLEGHLREF